MKNRASVILPIYKALMRMWAGEKSNRRRGNERMLLDRIARKIRREYENHIVTNYYILKDTWQKNRLNNPTIVGISDTLCYILENKCSVSRYGDGEIKWILGVRQDSFQEENKELANRLDGVLKSNGRNHIVCIANGFGDPALFNTETRRFWSAHMGRFRKDWISHIDNKKTYYSTDISRCYLSYKSSDVAKEAFKLWSKIFAGRDLLIVEGTKTRLGVGNDLLSGVKSIRRILVPAVNAYGKYKEIQDAVEANANREDLIILAIGPTATILAYDLAEKGYQAIDTGHLDIEYEWYKMKAISKVAIDGKYVNEAAWLGGRNVQESNNQEYLSQIICNL